MRTSTWFYHKVKPGETISFLASKYSVSPSDLAGHNNLHRVSQIGDGAISLTPNTEIKVYPIYIVVSGDTLSWIARDFKTTVAELVRLNNIPNPDLIYPGQKIRLPVPKAPPAPEPAIVPETSSVVPTQPYPQISNPAPPLYGDDIGAEHRLQAGSFYMRIGDCQFVIPPESISVTDISDLKSVDGVRQRGTIKSRTGYSRKDIQMTVWFNGPEQLNGVPINAPGGKHYWIDGLRALIAQFMKTPILPIENELLNLHHDIYNVVLSGLRASTVPQFPNLIQCDIFLQETTVAPYIMKHDVEYNDMIVWPLFRWFYQQPLCPTRPKDRIRLLPVPDSGLRNDLNFSILKEEVLIDARTTEPGYDPDDDMVSLDMNGIYPSTISISVTNRFAEMQVEEHSIPCHQFISPMDMTIEMVFDALTREEAKFFTDLKDTVDHYERSYRNQQAAGYIKIDNDFINLFGIKYAMLEAIASQTVKQQPEFSRVAVSMVAYDMSQARTQHPKGMSPLGTRDASLSDLESIWSNDNDYITHPIAAERMLNGLELYPDLELPTYEEADAAIALINSQRRSAGLSEIDFTLPRPGGVQSGGCVFVDPDFYVAYPDLKRGGLLDSSMFKGEYITTINPSKATQMEARDPGGGIQRVPYMGREGWLHLHLTTPSGLSPAELNHQILSYLKYKDPKDQAKSTLRNTGFYFWEAEQKHGVNAAFLLALAGHESAWGTSYYAINRYNFFGWQAYDHNPDNARWFKSAGEGILEVAKGIKKQFIDKGNKTIWQLKHNNNPGAYATDPEWHNMVARIANEILPFERIGTHVNIDVTQRLQEKSVQSWITSNTSDKTTNVGDPAPQLGDDELLNTMCHDMLKYSFRGRMVQAFPTYCLIFVDEGLGASGTRLWDNYYAYHSLLDISVVKERGNPVDVAFIRVSNIYGNLNTRQRLNYMPATLWEKLFPRINEKAYRNRQTLLHQIHIRAGCRIHLRLGYGSSACDLPITFNGTIAEIDVQDDMVMVCQGDGAELVHPIINWSPESKTRLFTWGNNPWSMIQEMMANPNFNFWHYRTGPPNGIVHFGTVKAVPLLGKALSIDDTYDVMKNVYSHKVGGKPDELVATGLQIWLEGKSVWDVINLLEKVCPGYVATVVPHQFRSTLFFGSPYWNVKYAYAYTDTGVYGPHKLVELNKPLCQYHYIDSGIDILANDIRATAADLITTCRALYTLGDNRAEMTPIQYADDTIKPELQRGDIVDSSLVKDTLAPNWWNNIFEKVDLVYHNYAKERAIQLARANLADAFRDMYQGELIIRGDPTIKPHDLIYINDVYNRVIGTAGVGRVIYNLGPQTGFTTSIKPDLLTTIKGLDLSVYQRMLSFGATLAAEVWKAKFLLSTVAKTAKIRRYVGIFGINISKIVSPSLAQMAFWSQTTKAIALLQSGIPKIQRQASKFLTGSQKRFDNLLKSISTLQQAPVLNPVGLIVTLVVWKAVDLLIERAFDWLEGRNVLQVYPLWHEDMPLLAGVDGYRYLVPGLPDPWYYGYDLSDLPEDTLAAPGTGENPIMWPVPDLYGLNEVPFNEAAHPYSEITVPEDTPVRSMTAGNAIFRDDGNTASVIVSTGMGYEFIYSNLKKDRVHTGGLVALGDILGYVDSQWGPTKLYLEVRQNGKPINPRTLIP
jgi:hypothetical protein